MSNHLSTERLNVRPAIADDLDAFFALWSDEALLEIIPANAQTRHECWRRILSDAGSWALSGYGQWMIFDKSNGRLIGHAGFFDADRGYGEGFDEYREAGWIFSSDTAGKGIATEALQEIHAWMDKHAFGVKTVCMMASHHIASKRVAQKCGYRLLKESTDELGPVTLMVRENPLAHDLT
jgi:RimJ/RimL family protein N-acetyltransferase